MSEKELTAKEIKKAILQSKTEAAKPEEECEIAGVKAWLFKASSYEMEGWRDYANSPDEQRRKLSSAKLVQISLRSKDGTFCFTDKEVPILAGLDDKVISPLVRTILRINGYTVEGAERILKNLLMTLGVDGLYDLLANINAPCPSCSKDTAPTSSESNT